ncbi:MAG: glucosamine-6-phosphate deaminase [Bacilli bacterium]|nr:glucosamine-6-phosphate deaminase [Bacilli bacterium]MDD4077117.1 glucosamine-6-phosphate deaminase [Bacilli bacterium]
MKIIIAQDYQELSERASQIVIGLLANKPDATLGLATGSTPVGLYQKLIEKYKKQVISFEKVKTFNLDEYCELAQEHPQSYYSYMHHQLFNHIDITEENINIPRGIGDELTLLCREYNEKLKAATIDLQVLGIGNNGHIGFNEPGTSFDQETFIVELTPETREANKRFFNSIDEVPRYAITMGIKNIIAANKILLLASGVAKAPAIKELIYGKINEKTPASILKKHPDVTVVLDREAASMIK